MLSDWSDDPDLLVDAADLLGSYSGTPLWDGTWEVLEELDEVAQGEFAEEKGTFGRGIVVMSDGEDTQSEKTLNQVIQRALELGIPVNTIGFGPASDSVDGYVNNRAVDGLRRLADETGGYYGYVDSLDDLPSLTTAIAGAQCGGHTELEATFTEPAPSGEKVKGQVKLKGTPIGVPFTFRAP